jgi:hypothetical protein
MNVIEPYYFVSFGAMDVTRPYELKKVGESAHNLTHSLALPDG